MSDKPTERTPRGWRHALYEWMIGPEPATSAASPASGARSPQRPPPLSEAMPIAFGMLAALSAFARIKCIAL